MAGKVRYGAVETILSQNETWRLTARRLMGILGVGLMALIASVALNAYLILAEPEDKIIAVFEDGSIVPIVPISERYLSDVAVVNFAVEAATESLSMRFDTWRQDLAEATDYFERPNGWNNFLRALEASKTLDFIRNNDLNSTVVANGGTVVSRGQRPNGAATWIVQIPIAITYQGRSQGKTNNYMVEMEIVRVSTREISRGVAVSKIIVGPYRASAEKPPAPNRS